MERKIIIRNEEKSDWPRVEDITRRVFYNICARLCGALLGAYHARA